MHIYLQKKPNFPEVLYADLGDFNQIQKPPAEHEYAQVDRSNNKKKEEQDAAYAQVDMSKKSKKVWIYFVNV